MSEMIPAELADRARRVLSGHQILPGKRRPGRPSKLLVGRHRMNADGKSYNCQLRAAGGECPTPASAWCTAIEKYVAMRWLSRFTNASPDDPLVRILAERWQALTQPKRTAQYDDAVAAVKAAEAAIEQLANDRAAGLYSGAMGKHFPRLVREAEAKLETTQEQLNTLSGESRLDFAVLTNPLWARLKWRDANPELKRELVGLAIDRILVTRAPKQGARFDGWSRVNIKWADGSDDYSYPAQRKGALQDIWEGRPNAA